MSGHSKWHKVRQFKGAVDAKRSASFTKLAREVTVAAREGGGDPDMNVRLRVAIDHAKKESMPKEGIERAIDRGTGASKGDILEECIYGAYVSGGAAILIACTTDNRNRTVAEVKNTLTKQGVHFADASSVTYLFTHEGWEWKPIMTIELSDEDGEKLSSVIEALDHLDDVAEVYTNAN
ncbi:MAG: YebC/PmpR family DNA-binding transcriptional regulator [bacterium]|nr:YebC/PmpR family DNA-binding transcriptional regulator [bacterium]